MVNLKPFVGRKVVVALKQPYQYQLCRASGGEPVPVMAVKLDGNRVGFAEPGDPNGVPIAVGAISGTLLEREGNFAIAYADPTAQIRTTMEVVIHPDLIAFVTVIGETSRILRPVG